MLSSHVVSRRVPPAAHRRGDRGAVLVHAAVAMAGLLAFSALTVDLGTLWVARGQIQNAADAAALAGAVDLAYGDPSDPAARVAGAQAAAQSIAREHRVWGQALGAASVPTPPVGACPTPLPGRPIAPDCLRIQVERRAASGTPLPVFFARLFGAGSTDVWASATGGVLLDNTTPCPRPIAIPDSWLDTFDVTPDGGWTPDDLYERYADAGFAVPPPNADTYVAPTAMGPGDGFTVPTMYGATIRLMRHPIWLSAPLGAGDVLSLDLSRPGGAADLEARFEENMRSCTSVPMSIGQSFPAANVHRDRLRIPIEDLFDLDPAAVWDGTAIRNSAFSVSPRLVTVAVIDPDGFAQQPRPGPVDLVVTNLVGLFLSRPTSYDVEGVIVPIAGTYEQTAPSLTADSTFLRTVTLVR